MVGGPKNQVFGQESTYSKIFFLNLSMNYSSSKSVKIVLSKSIFYVKNQPNFFKKKNSSKNINLGDPFLLKTFFLDSIFEPFYLLHLLHDVTDISLAPKSNIAAWVGL